MFVPHQIIVVIYTQSTPNSSFGKFELSRLKLHRKWPERSRDDAVARALASHQCGSGSIPRPSVISGLSFLLALYSAPRGFSPGPPVFSSPKKTNISKFQFDLE